MYSTGKLVMECILETKAATILEFVHGLRGSLHVAYIQGCGHPSCSRTWPISGVLCQLSCPRNETVDGAAHPGAQDCGDHFARLEERSLFRRRTSETTSSLSVCREPVHPCSHPPAMAYRFFRRSGSRASIRNPVRRNGCFGQRVSRETLCPLGQPEKVIGRESQIEPWLALHNHSACLRQKPKGVATT